MRSITKNDKLTGGLLALSMASGCSSDSMENNLNGDSIQRIIEDTRKLLSPKGNDVDAGNSELPCLKFVKFYKPGTEEVLQEIPSNFIIDKCTDNYISGNVTAPIKYEFNGIFTENAMKGVANISFKIPKYYSISSGYLYDSVQISKSDIPLNDKVIERSRNSIFAFEGSEKQVKCVVPLEYGDCGQAIHYVREGAVRYYNDSFCLFEDPRTSNCETSDLIGFDKDGTVTIKDGLISEGQGIIVDVGNLGKESDGGNYVPVNLDNGSSGNDSGCSISSVGKETSSSKSGFLATATAAVAVAMARRKKRK